MPKDYCVRLLLADASPIFLDAAARFLAQDHWLLVIGQAGSGAQALTQAGRLAPDLALVDVSLPDISGLEVARRMKDWPDGPRVVVLGLSDGEEYRRSAWEAGADGYVAKIEFEKQLYGLLREWYGDRFEPSRLSGNSAQPTGRGGG